LPGGGRAAGKAVAVLAGGQLAPQGCRAHRPSRFSQQGFRCRGCSCSVVRPDSRSCRADGSSLAGLVRGPRRSRDSSCSSLWSMPWPSFENGSWQVACPLLCSQPPKAQTLHPVFPRLWVPIWGASYTRMDAKEADMTVGRDTNGKGGAHMFDDVVGASGTRSSRGITQSGRAMHDEQRARARWLQQGQRLNLLLPPLLPPNVCMPQGPLPRQRAVIQASISRPGRLCETP